MDSIYKNPTATLAGYGWLDGLAHYEVLAEFWIGVKSTTFGHHLSIQIKNGTVLKPASGLVS